MHGAMNHLLLQAYLSVEVHRLNDTLAAANTHALVKICYEGI